MQLHFYRPRDPILSDLIEGYYFLRGTSAKDELSYYTFPNNFSIVSVLENSEISIQKNRVACTPAASPCFQSNLTCNYTEPLLIQYSGPLNEMTIYFKPLGLNAFLPAAMLYQQSGNFRSFNPFTDFKEVMLHILRLTDREQQVALLEDYWASKILFVRDPLLVRIINELERGQNIAQIADSLSLSRQYLSRLFLKNLGKTPASYRKIHRFRTAVKSKNTYGNLTTLGLENYFYDQSHFISTFKQLTTLSPKQFFNKVDAHKDNLWLYV